MGRPKKSICNQGYDKDQMKMHLETNIGNNYDVFCYDFESMDYRWISKTRKSFIFCRLKFETVSELFFRFSKNYENEKRSTYPT